MPVYTVELTFILCVSVEADNEREATAQVLADEEVPLPTWGSANVTDVYMLEEEQREGGYGEDFESYPLTHHMDDPRSHG